MSFACGRERRYDSTSGVAIVSRAFAARIIAAHFRQTTERMLVGVPSLSTTPRALPVTVSRETGTRHQ